MNITIYETELCREDSGMQIRYDSVHFHILERLCVMPKAVRGMAPAMLQRQFGDLVAVEELAAAGLLRKRGWADGPGWVWIPTEAGLTLHERMRAAPNQSPSVTSGDRILLPKDPVRDPTGADQRSS